jgi:hypothetical protein
MPRKPPSAKALNQKALCTLVSCLEVLKIEHRLDPSGVLVGDLVVKVEAQFGMDSVRVGNEVFISPLALCCGPDRAHFALWTLTEAIGHGKPVVFNRGQPRTRRVYGDDHDAVVMRERSFRQSVNPPREAFEKYAPWIDTCVRFYFMSNRELCIALGFGPDDLKTYALVWFSNFWTTTRLLNPKAESENNKLLYRFLRQRFSQLYQQMHGPRRRNVMADQDSIRVGLAIQYKIIQDGGAGPCLQAVNDTDPELDPQEEAQLAAYRARVGKLDTSTPDKRRNSAVTLLNESLAAMPHDSMVSALTQTVTSVFACPDTRREAKRQLDRHRQACLACSATSVAPLLPAESPSLDGFEIRVDAIDEDGIVEELSLSEGL